MLQRALGVAGAIVAAVALGAAAAPAVAGVGTRPCPEAPGGRCGTVAVPLDRADPAAGTIRIGFEVYPPTRRGRGLGTVLAMPDGPGSSSTSARGAFFSALGSVRSRFALLLVDRRGTGKSRAVSCGPLQRGRGPFPAAIAACGAQLGGDSDRYGAADVAEDIEAVRAALGIARMDLYGAAYGAVDTLAYSVRHPDRVRSLVLASPVTPLDRDPWGTDQVPAFSRAVAAYCSRSRSCAAQSEGPATLIPELVQRLRASPVRVTAVGRDGRRRRVVLDEAQLAEMARNMRGDMITHGELTGAARALLRAGDAAPLARLAAEADPIPADRDAGPPVQSGVSVGAQAAALCTDSPVPWDVGAPRAARGIQYEAARLGLAADRFAPFSVAAWTDGGPGRWDGSFDLVGSASAYRVAPCLDWPAPDRTVAPIPAGSALPGVPALVLASDTSVHSPREDVDALAALLPGARRVEVSGMDHIPAVVEPCVAGIVGRFLRTLDPGRTDCAPDPGGPWYAPGSFPRRAADAVPARVDPRGRNRVGPRGRRLATVAVSAVMDAYYHSTPGAPMHGLRGGQVEARIAQAGPELTPVFDLVLRRARFSRDVRVSGTIGIDLERGQVFSGRLSVAGGGLGARPSVITIGGQFYASPDRPVRVRGRIGGRPAALLVDVY